MEAMWLGRFFGWLCLLAAGAVLTRDVLAWSDLRLFAPESLAGLWADLDGGSLRHAHAAIASAAPWLWTFVVAPILSLWATPLFAVIGLWLLWRCRRERRHWR